MAQVRLSSLPEDANNFIIIHRSESDLALLPRRFVRNNPIIMPYQNALLTDPANNTFSVSLRTVNGDKGIESFQEIYQAHHITGTVRVHYTYIRGSQFYIRIFHDEYTEVAYIEQEDSDDDYVVIEQEDSDDEEELAWLSDITEPRSYGRQCLHVPANVAIELIPHRPPSLNIILPDGNLDEWFLKWADVGPIKLTLVMAGMSLAGTVLQDASTRHLPA